MSCLSGTALPGNLQFQVRPAHPHDQEQEFQVCAGLEQKTRLVCASPAVLPLYAASHRYCGGPLQRNAQGIRALTCSHSLRWKRLSTSLAEYLSFDAFWMEMQPQLYHISTATDRGTLLSAAVPMVRALLRGGAAAIYVINTWLWNFGWPQPRVGGLSVAKTERIRRNSRSDAAKRAWATLAKRDSAGKRPSIGKYLVYT